MIAFLTKTTYRRRCQRVNLPQTAQWLSIVPGWSAIRNLSRNGVLGSVDSSERFRPRSGLLGPNSFRIARHSGAILLAMMIKWLVCLFSDASGNYRSYASKRPWANIGPLTEPTCLMSSAVLPSNDCNEYLRSETRYEN